TGQDEIQKDERVRIGGADQNVRGVDSHPDQQEHAEGDDEGPGAAEMRDQIGDFFAEGHVLVDDVVDVLDLQAGKQFVRAAQPVDDDAHELAGRIGVVARQDGDDVQRNADQAGVGRGARGGGPGLAVEHGEFAEERARLQGGENDFLPSGGQDDVDHAVLDD